MKEGQSCKRSSVFWLPWHSSTTWAGMTSLNKKKRLMVAHQPVKKTPIAIIYQDIGLMASKGVEIMETKRGFKGIWIPKEIWLNPELNIMEKLFLVEIDSLDNEQGCFASNAHFAEFFGITKGRCSQIIKALEEKKLIAIEYEYEGKQVTRRVIRVVNELNGVVNKLKGGSENIKGGYLENAQGSNTSFSNTSLDINNKNKAQPENETEHEEPKDENQEPEQPNVHLFYQQNIYPMEPPIVAQDLDYWVADLSAEVVIYALQLTAENNAKYSYTKSILLDWAQQGVKTVEQARMEAATRKQQQKQARQPKNYNQRAPKVEKLPKWAAEAADPTTEQHQEEEMISEEQQAEFMERLKRFREGRTAE